MFRTPPCHQTRAIAKTLAMCKKWLRLTLQLITLEVIVEVAHLIHRAPHQVLQVLQVVQAVQVHGSNIIHRTTIYPQLTSRTSLNGFRLLGKMTYVIYLTLLVSIKFLLQIYQF